MSTHTDHLHDRKFVRTFFTTPTAVEGEDDSATMLRSAVQLRGMQAPDVWVPDNEDATAPSMRGEGIENIIDVISEHGVDYPGEIHPRMVWHRDSSRTRYQGFQHMMRLADPNHDVIEHLDGFVLPEVGDIDDWKKADEFITIVETDNGLEEGSLTMSVIIESAEAELALADLREEMGKPSNNLDRLFLLVDGEVDYTKDMRAITPTGELPSWPELRHNTARGASAAGLIAVDGPFDDIRDMDGYHERMTENQAKGVLGIWSLTPGQVVEANRSPLPPKTGSWQLNVNGQQVELEPEDDRFVYVGDGIELEETGEDRFELTLGGVRKELDKEELSGELLDIASYIPSLNDIVDSMEEFEKAKEAGKGAITMNRSTTIVIDDIEVPVSNDRMWDEATYQASKTPINLFQDVWVNRPDQHEHLEELYGEDLVERATLVG